MHIKKLSVNIPNYNTNIYSCIINEEELNKKIINKIDEVGDQQQHITNIKADMTSYKMMDHPGFKELKDIVLNLVSITMEHQYNFISNSYKIYTMWGAKYKSNEYALKHSHFPSLLSFVYYINPPSDSPELLFNDCNLSIKPEHGQLIIFNSCLLHEVKQKSFKGSRYVVAGNITYVED